jgi:hypothetical protein
MKLIDRIMGVMEDVIMRAAYVLLVLMVINTAGGVFFRYVLHNAISLTEELGRYMMIYVGFFGCHGISDGQFAFPIGAAVDDRGRIYVADTANGRVQVWSY